MSQTKPPEIEPVSPIRTLTGNQKRLAVSVAVLLSLFTISVNGLMNIQEIYRNIIFLGFLLVLTYLLYPARKKSVSKQIGITDYLFVILSIVGSVYIYFQYTTIHVERGSVAIGIDYVFAVILILMLLEAGRRTIGLFIPLLAALAMIYALFGPYFPGLFGHAGFSIERFLYRMYMTTEGIFGITLSIASTYIIIFILFGAFLNASGASALFNDLALAIAGRTRGGPAQVAVISSAMTGSLNGSAVANVATTGAFTIPLMKSIGLKPRFAAAVEAAASTGGMVMPPIMGAAAFIMAGFLGVPFSVILLAAIIPSILYYAGLIIAVDLEAKKQGLKGISKENIPKVWAVLKERGVLLLPIIIVFGTLLAGKTPLFAGFAGIIAVILSSWLTLDRSNRITWRKMITALEEGGRGGIQVGIACASVGILIAVVTMTGLGNAIAYNVLALSGGSLAVLLILIMITCIVLSMGLPSTALYIVVAVTAAPALIEAGVNPVAAHFFVFWFGAMSNITPPVALASYTAAGIAGADAMKTSWTALKLTLPGFIIPFMIAYNPVMIMQPAAGETVTAWSIILAFATALLGVFVMSLAIHNFFSVKLNLIERVVFFITSLLLIHPGGLTDAIGVAVFAAFFAGHIMRSKKQVSSANEAF
ncbi:TRAP transporter permease [Metabacillus iocasae]|uniref:TRAP transporter 4TM/12TM fusion protein n=1 Tax=Priestia iocasae TaxID=2291674 RepID=A0ABS2QX05_9BACI|nr:TRAP transporter permease [Metabacillus iocasae]MBM7703009.1 TRAP transporter 4TM/12TM fusion protein [Metabacillus iocasae]